MKSFVLVAMSLVGSSAQVLPNRIRTCSTNADCAEYGDTGATCTVGTGLCTCGTGYSAYSAVPSGQTVASTFSSCFATGNVNNQHSTVDVVFSLTFPTANCESIGAVRSDFLLAAKKALTGTSAEVKDQGHSCFETVYTQVPNTLVPATIAPTPLPDGAIPPTPAPPTAAPATLSPPLTAVPPFVPSVVTTGTGVYASVIAEVKVQDLYSDQVVNFDTRIRSQLNTYSTLHYQTSTKYTLNTLKGTSSLCPTIGVATKAMAYFEIDTSSRTQCRPSQCITGWWVTEEGLCRDSTNRPYPINPAEDDDLSGAKIIAIVASISVFLVIVFIIIYCLCCKKKSDKDKDDGKNNPDEDESPDEEKPSDEK
eukprot:TRINITY_DN13457_c0_g1_i1.p1 TRINITY_DN13457_c0_g1~~TRINITY_DN13457_c0_g1_i1.p1  ORF type:complete len:379 (+),score=82.28 TRINITY_DN13457_c0_g1_i1:42-1139(+)